MITWQEALIHVLLILVPMLGVAAVLALVADYIVAPWMRRR